jgi:hypothetical protein
MRLSRLVRDMGDGIIPDVANIWRHTHRRNFRVKKSIIDTLHLTWAP